MPTCIHPKQYIAKRPHKKACHYCPLPILPGERVHRNILGRERIATMYQLWQDMPMPSRTVTDCRRHLR